LRVRLQLPEVTSDAKPEDGGGPVSAAQ
jgi:hypothetical protein